MTYGTNQPQAKWYTHITHMQWNILHANLLHASNACTLHENIRICCLWMCSKFKWLNWFLCKCYWYIVTVHNRHSSITSVWYVCNYGTTQRQHCSCLCFFPYSLLFYHSSQSSNLQQPTLTWALPCSMLEGYSHWLQGKQAPNSCKLPQIV